MNNNRLSTNSNPLTLDMATKSELDLLIKSKPLINIDSEGRAMIINAKKYIRSTYIIKAAGARSAPSRSPPKGGRYFFKRFYLLFY